MTRGKRESKRKKVNYFVSSSVFDLVSHQTCFGTS